MLFWFFTLFVCYIAFLCAYKQFAKLQNSPIETTFPSCLDVALFPCYKITQSRNTILIARLADQSEYTGLIRSRA